MTLSPLKETACLQRARQSAALLICDDALLKA